MGVTCGTNANDQTQASLYFTNAANTAVKNPGRILISKTNSGSAIFMISQVSDSAIVTLTGSDTHKLRIVRTDDQGSGAGQYSNSSVAGSSIYAVRIR